jgi:outer membrane protein W
MRTTLGICACLAAFAVLAAPAHAAAGDSIWRFGALWVSPDGEFSLDDETTDPNLFILSEGEADDAFGLSIAYEYMVVDQIGIEFNAMWTEFDFDATQFALTAPGGEDEIEDFDGDFSMMPLTLGVNFHFGEVSEPHLYLGPVVGWAFYGDVDWNDDDNNIGDVTVPGLDATDVDDDFIYGGVVGFDWPIGGGNWTFNARGRYLVSQAEEDAEDPDTFDVDIDPWMIEVGFGYRWP